MRMNRRDFLKGMLALAGTAVLTGTETAILQAVDSIEPKYFIAGVPSTRPGGRLGTLWLGEEAYSLEDASITMLRRFNPPIFVPAFMPGQYNRAGGGELVASSWQVDFFVREDKAMKLLEGLGEIQFHIDFRFAEFFGKGYLQSVGVDTTFVDGEGLDQLFEIKLEGDQKLSRFKV